MALGLKDLKKGTRKKEVARTNKLRPWENFEKQENQLKTFTAQEAVKNAKKIMQRNELLIEQIYRRRRARLTDHIH